MTQKNTLLGHSWIDRYSAEKGLVTACSFLFVLAGPFCYIPRRTGYQTCQLIHPATRSVIVMGASGQGHHQRTHGRQKINTPVEQWRFAAPIAVGSFVRRLTRPQGASVGRRLVGWLYEPGRGRFCHDAACVCALCFGLLVIAGRRFILPRIGFTVGPRHSRLNGGDFNCQLLVAPRPVRGWQGLFKPRGI